MLGEIDGDRSIAGDDQNPSAIVGEGRQKRQKRTLYPANHFSRRLIRDFAYDKRCISYEFWTAECFSVRVLDSRVLFARVLATFRTSFELLSLRAVARSRGRGRWWSSSIWPCRDKMTSKNERDSNPDGLTRSRRCYPLY